ncbi:GAF domain-containing protein [Alteromonas pelagimontana]|uniref:GAF domain-containing protein n=1 Tax=Alteromonas pelagimontana TaxID=1858656 RepID=A0A6M4MEZ5_9ALTE|nr:GAF domain-containing protein [Alteromonas pelagimontana]QJR81210.1 GAF domain-containing protein [Alteromonas pelagimontana]
MTNHTVLKTESDRLSALYQLEILDTPPDERFDAITAKAQQYFNSSICLISFVADDRQWFKSRQGLDAVETERHVSFCAYAIAEEEYLYIPDTHEDFRFRNNPLVKGAPFIRAYAGAIIYSPDGYALGTLCIIHNDVLVLSDEDITMLMKFAKMVEAELAAQQQSVEQ